MSLFFEIDNSLSPFNPESTVSKINNCISDSIDHHFNKVYNKSKLTYSQTGGLFDPTLAPLIRAWGFGQGHKVSSDTLNIDSLLNFVGINKTKIEGYRLVKENPEIEFNFSALAKGYGVDCIAEMFLRNGVRNYLVEIGGEIRCSGMSPSNKSWQIGIDRPENGVSPGNIITTISLSDSALATSGNYRHFHELNGKKFGHTISPITGKPLATDVISASIVAPTCMEADAFATCCMALGSKKSIELCDSLHLGVMLILNDMHILTNQYFPSK